MYVVIQEIKLKKPDKYGDEKQLEAYLNNWRMDKNKPYTWAYRQTGGRFERPHREAYRISVHQSYRDGGKVRKRQYSITTMSYYNFAEYGLEDCIRFGVVEKTAAALGVDAKDLLHMIYEKIDPLDERIRAEFQASDEYKARCKRKAIIAKHETAQRTFMQRYDVDRDEYDRCYDVFGTLRNPEYLEQIKQEYIARQRQQRKQRSYSEQSYSNHTGGSYDDFFRGYADSSKRNYSADDKSVLKEFYKALSKKYHPDLNRDKDTTEQMKLLNRLKDDWGI